MAQLAPAPQPKAITVSAQSSGNYALIQTKTKFQRRSPRGRQTKFLFNNVHRHGGRIIAEKIRPCSRAKAPVINKSLCSKIGTKAGVMGLSGVPDLLPAENFGHQCPPGGNARQKTNHHGGVMGRGGGTKTLGDDNDADPKHDRHAAIDGNEIDQ